MEKKFKIEIRGEKGWFIFGQELTNWQKERIINFLIATAEQPNGEETAEKGNTK